MILKRIFLLLYLLAIIIFLAHFFILKTAVYGDGRYYYSYLPSAVINHTLDFTRTFNALDISYFRTPLGFPANIYPVGPAIIWLIPFLFIHLILFFFGINDGYNYFYQISIGVFNVTLVFIGLYLLKKTLINFFSKKIAIFTVLTLFLTTNLFFYGSIDVINSHSLSFSLSSLFIYLWVNNKNPIFLGSVIGLLALVRPQDALFFIFPLSTLIILKKSYLLKFLIITLSSAIVFLPQLFVWKIIWGSWYINPYLNVETFNFLSPQIFGVLFNKGSGLFLWTPILMIALFGLTKFSHKLKRITSPAQLFFFSQLYLISSWSIWWQGASYSGRMFISSLPVLSFGLAYFFSMKSIEKFRLPIILFFSSLNIFLVIFFLLSN